MVQQQRRLAHSRRSSTASSPARLEHRRERARGRVALVTGRLAWNRCCDRCSVRAGRRAARSERAGCRPRSKRSARRSWMQAGKRSQCAADVTRFDDIEQMRRTIEDRFGPADIVVANAGGSPVRPGPVEDLSEEELARVDRREPHLDLPDDQELPAGHEGARARKHHHVVVGRGASARTREARSRMPRRRRGSSCSPRTWQPRLVRSACGRIASRPRRS